MNNTDVLSYIKSRIWFYKFDLPGGVCTNAELPPEALAIHDSRRLHLVEIIQKFVSDAHNLTAADLACHQGFFSIELARRFNHVRALDVRPEHIEDATFIADQLNVKNISFRQFDLQDEPFSADMEVDFVLCYGLLYHIEDPISTLRLASKMARKHILLETQIFPLEISGQIEDGHYQYQRPIEGMFALAPDYSGRHMGGATDLALIPSQNGLVYLLKHFGFSYVEIVSPKDDDYEQFIRGQRIIVYARK